MEAIKKSMAQSLRELSVNDKRTFNLARRTSVISTLQRLNAEGYRFSTETSRNKRIYIVSKVQNPEPESLTV